MILFKSGNLAMLPKLPRVSAAIRTPPSYFIASTLDPVVTGDWVTVLGPLKAGLLGKLWKPCTSGPFAHREGHLVPLNREVGWIILSIMSNFWNPLKKCYQAV